MSKFEIGDVVQCSDTNSTHFMDGGAVFETVPGMCRVRLYISNKIVAFHNNQLTLINANKTSIDSDGPNYNEDEPTKEPFRHTDLGTDLSGDALMDSIRAICGR